MEVMGSLTLGVFVTVLLLLSGAAVAVFDGYDGMPRPAGMDQEPTTTYGTKPAVKYDNKVADCIWYGWENGYYPPEGTKNCSASLWASLSHSNPASLAAFMYYAPFDSIYFDPAYNQYLCTIGCFDLSASGPASPPKSTPGADSPGAGSLPPPAAPPVVSAPPPHATLFRPPPPAPPLPPSPSPDMPPMESASSPESSPVSSPSPSPGSSPSSEPSPSSSPGVSVPGTSVVQTSSAATSAVSAVLVFTVALFLSGLIAIASD